MLRVLVTGGAGYVGSVLCRQLLDAGFSVTAFDKLDYGIAPINHLLSVKTKGKFSCIRGDVRDVVKVKRAVSEIDVVLHLAAIVGFPACAADPSMALETNVNGSKNVAACVSRNQIFVYASTGSTYGLVDGVCTEETPISPLSHYGKTKADAEIICRDAGAACLRFATVFGNSPCMRYDLLINNFVWQAVRRKYLVIYEGGHRRTFVHVQDAAASYIHAMTKWADVAGKVFNVGSDDLNLTKREAADAVAKFYPMYIHAAEVGKDADCRNYKVDYSKFAELGYKATVQLDDGIKEIGEAAKLLDVANNWRIE